jgi:hypothetical protein
LRLDEHIVGALAELRRGADRLLRLEGIVTHQRVQRVGL